MSYTRCPKGYLCAFTGTGGTGAIAKYKTGDGNLANGYGPRGMNRNIESVWNRTGDEFLLFNQAGYRGKATLVEAYGKGTIKKPYRKPRSLDRPSPLNHYY